MERRLTCSRGNCWNLPMAPTSVSARGRASSTGPFEDDPNLTDKEFRSNPTRSCRTREPRRVVGEVLHWEPYSPAVLQDMRNHLEELKRLGTETIHDWARR